MKTKLTGGATLLALISISNLASAQNLLENGSFENGSSGWSLPGWSDGGSGQSSIEDGIFCIDVESDEGPTWATDLKQSGLSFSAGEEYTLTFKAWASTPVHLPTHAFDGGDFILGTTVLVDAPLNGEPNLIAYTAPAETSSDAAFFYFVFGGGIVPAGATLCLDDVVLSRSEVEVGSFLSFEDPDRLWTSAQQSPSISRIEGGVDGDYALSVNGRGYVEITSPLFETEELDFVSSTLAVDVLLSEQQSNPWWLGDLSLFVSVPSAGIYHQWAGMAFFSQATPGSWTTLTIQIPTALRQALEGNYSDAQLHLAVNTDNGAGSTLLDNVRFVSN